MVKEKYTVTMACQVSMQETPMASDLVNAAMLLSDPMYEDRHVHIEYKGEPYHVSLSCKGEFGCWNFRADIKPGGYRVYGLIFPLTEEGLQYAEELGNTLNALIPCQRTDGKRKTECRNRSCEPFYSCVGSCMACRFRHANGSIPISEQMKSQVKVYVDMHMRAGRPYQVNIDV